MRCQLVKGVGRAPFGGVDIACGDKQRMQVRGECVCMRNTMHYFLGKSYWNLRRNYEFRSVAV